MGKVITFAQQKGGAGKTTMLAHLAASWAEAGRSVALIDLDPQKSLTRWAELRADPGLALLDSATTAPPPTSRPPAATMTTSWSIALVPPRACSRTSSAKAT